MPQSNPPTCGHPDNKFWIGGEVLWASEIREECEAVFRRIMLRCDYGARKPSLPTFRVFGDLADHLAAVPKHSRVCLGGRVHTYIGESKEGRRPRKTWSLDVDTLLAEGSLSVAQGADCASNMILLRGEPGKPKKARVPGTGHFKCTVEVCCAGDNGEINHPKVVAFEDGGYELLEHSKAERVQIVANLVTPSLPGKPFIPMTIRAFGVAAD